MFEFARGGGGAEAPLDVGPASRSSELSLGSVFS
jgi:hypothetical protein